MTKKYYQYGWEYPPEDHEEAMEEYLSFMDDKLVLTKTPEEVAEVIINAVEIDSEAFTKTAIRLSNKYREMFGESAMNRFQLVINQYSAIKETRPINW